MIGVKFFYKIRSHLNGLRLVLSNLKIVELQFLATVDNDISYHLTLEDFQRWLQGEKCSLTYQYSISSEKAKATIFARLCRFINCLQGKITKAIKYKNFWEQGFGCLWLYLRNNLQFHWVMIVWISNETHVSGDSSENKQEMDGCF